MRITGVRVATNATAASYRDLWLKDGRVYFSPPSTMACTSLDLSGFMVLPGLINAHDHLEFNLFPNLGDGPYPNATAWAKAIFRPHDSPIKEHLGVPKPIRLIWGALKNLLSGVTTVAHHNAYHPVFGDPIYPVRVVQHYGWAHSLQFSPNWLDSFRQTSENDPFIIHAGEGTDEPANAEFKIMAAAGAIGPSTVLVHGVALSRLDANFLAEQGGALVWCPTSNHFTLGRSLKSDVLQSGVSIALATDSAITGAGDLFDEFLVARRFVSTNRLYRAVTEDAARILKLPPGFGEIRDGGPADLLFVEDRDQTPAETLSSNYPQAVMLAGRIRVASPAFAIAARVAIQEPLHPLDLETRGRYLLTHDVRSLIRATRQVLNENLRLAGKAVAA